MPILWFSFIATAIVIIAAWEHPCGGEEPEANLRVRAS
jgi:hypothetical protein